MARDWNPAGVRNGTVDEVQVLSGWAQDGDGDRRKTERDEGCGVFVQAEPPKKPELFWTLHVTEKDAPQPHTV